MNNKLFVGNLAYSTTDAELQTLFSQVGPVTSVAVIKDRETGRPRGFAFVEMETSQLAESAISQLNGQEVGGRQISVSISQPKSNGGGGGGGGRPGGRR